MRLNGWQRLWVVASAIYLLVVVAGACYLSPSEFGPSQISHRQEFLNKLPAPLRKKVLFAAATADSHCELLVYDREAKLSGKPLATRSSKKGKPWEQDPTVDDFAVVAKFALVAKMENGVELCFYGRETTHQDIDEITKRYNSELHARFMTELVVVVLVVLFAWFVPCVAVYALGLSIGWVRRGFTSA